METAVRRPMRAGMIFTRTESPSSAPWVRGAVHIHAPPRAPDCQPRQQERDHQGGQIHRLHLPNAARSLAVRIQP